MIFGLVLSLIFVGVLLPLGLDAILGMVLPSTLDANLETLIIVVVPLAAVIGVIYGFLRQADIL